MSVVLSLLAHVVAALADCAQRLWRRFRLGDTDALIVLATLAVFAFLFRLTGA